jgi:hypothetical protein
MQSRLSEAVEFWQGEFICHWSFGFFICHFEERLGNPALTPCLCVLRVSVLKSRLASLETFQH